MIIELVCQPPRVLEHGVPAGAAVGAEIDLPCHALVGKSADPAVRAFPSVKRPQLFAACLTTPVSQ